MPPTHTGFTKLVQGSFHPLLHELCRNIENTLKLLIEAAGFY